MPCIQANCGEQQGERYGERNNDRAPDVTKKDKQNNDDQDHSVGEIVQHCVGREMHQIVAIQVGNDRHAGRKDMIVQLFDGGMDAFHRRCRVSALSHEHDAFDDIVIVHNHSIGTMDRPAYLAEPDLGSLSDSSNIPNTYGCAFLRFEDGFLDVLDIPDQTDLANIDLLFTLLDETATAIRICV